MWWMVAAALAQEPGIEVVQAGETVTPQVKSFLLPEPYYNSCLEHAQARIRLEGQLERLAADIANLPDGTAATALVKELERCDVQVQNLHIVNTRLHDNQARLKRQRNVAIGGVVGVAAVAVFQAWLLSQQ